MKTLGLTLMTLLALAAPHPVRASEEPQAQDTAVKAAPRPSHRGERLAQALQLTADQKTKFKALRATQREAMAPKREAAQEARAAFVKALQDPATPEATLRDLHQRASEAHFQVLLASRTNSAQMRTLLTPEQREKAVAIFATHRDRARDRKRMQWMAPQN